MLWHWWLKNTDFSPNGSSGNVLNFSMCWRSGGQLLVITTHFKAEVPPLWASHLHFFQALESGSSQAFNHNPFLPNPHYQEGLSFHNRIDQPNPKACFPLPCFQKPSPRELFLWDAPIPSMPSIHYLGWSLEGIDFSIPTLLIQDKCLTCLKIQQYLFNCTSWAIPPSSASQNRMEDTGHVEGL
ncbi:hypothetical protein GH733_002457 [Mirounga leonina]|nr:hypothetical protein GH733_002457 [Mirounga leonina]